MPTIPTLVVSSPNINGNVSDCNTVISILNGSARPNIFIQEDTAYATNNCTGHTDTFFSWELTGFSGICITIVFIPLCFVAVFMVLKMIFD